MLKTLNISKKTINTLLLILTMQLLVNCGAEDEVSETDFVKSKRPEDTRIIRVETREKLEGIYTKSQEENLDSSKKSYTTQVRFRLCASQHTPLDDCLYLAQGSWMSLKQITDTAKAITTNASSGTTMLFTMGTLYTLIGAIPGVINLKRGRSFGAINSIFAGLGGFALSLGTLSVVNKDMVKENKVITITTNPNRNFTTKNLDALIIEIDILPRLLQSTVKKGS